MEKTKRISINTFVGRTLAFGRVSAYSKTIIMELIQVISITLISLFSILLGFWLSFLIYKTKAIREMMANNEEQIKICRGNIEVYKDDPDQVYAYELMIKKNQFMLSVLSRKLSE